MAGNYGDPDPEVIDRVRPLCMALPEVVEQDAWAGTRWQVARRTFAHVLTVLRPDELAELTVLTFRAEGEDLHVLAHVGHPFFRLGWGRDAMGMLLDDRTDWSEVAEVVRDSYCVMAPKRLAKLLTN
jgi:hypothetical protein